MIINSYPKIYNLGHSAIKELFNEYVVVEEKIDGSQISFMRKNDTLHIRSKGQEIFIDNPDNMFKEGVEQIKAVFDDLCDDYIYRGEYLKKPKHNSLTYGRIPKNHIILFDIDMGNQEYVVPFDKQQHADDLGFECVPLLFTGKIFSAAEVFHLMETDSILGNTKIEGMVIKNYCRYGVDGKSLMGKHVSEAFKEIHIKEWKKTNKNSKDILTEIGENLRTEARWNKAIQHLRDNGQLTTSPKDIGPLMKEIQTDLKAEAEDYIKGELYKWAISHLTRKATAGFPEWYKNKLVEYQFETEKLLEEV